MIKYSDNFVKEAKKLSKKFKLIKSDLKRAVKEIESKEDLGIYLGYNLYKKRVQNSSIPTGKSGGFRIIIYEEKAFYDILKSIAVKFDFSYPEDKLIELSKEVKKVVDDKTKYTDWNVRDDIKAELKVDLIMLLAKHGYPPITKDEVFKEIFEQAENFKKYKGVNNDVYKPDGFMVASENEPYGKDDK